MISDLVYKQYFDSLLEGRRNECRNIVQKLLEQDPQILKLYTDLFQRSLYRVGELWEHNRITVAREHLVTAITEGLMNLTYPFLFQPGKIKQGKTIIVSCAANEYHQIGGRMVADICELNGWDAHFLGANTPVCHLVEFIDEVKPDLVGLSLGVYYNLSRLKEGLEVIRSNYHNLDIIVGGQGFRWGGVQAIGRFPGTEYVESLEALKHSVGRG